MVLPEWCPQISMFTQVCEHKCLECLKEAKDKRPEWCLASAEILEEMGGCDYDCAACLEVIVCKATTRRERS